MLSTRGGYPTKLLSFQDAIELIMVLPGKMAKETRTKFADVLTRYMAGDQSLVEEIQANAVSTSPIAELARGGDGGAAAGSSLGKRPASMHLIRMQFKKTNTKMDTINEKTMEKFDTLNENMVSVKDNVATVVDNSHELSTLTAMAKASDQKAKFYEQVSYKARGESGARVAKKYREWKKELKAAQLKIDVLTRQRTDFANHFEKLEAGQAVNRSEQADLKVGQADLKSEQAEIKAAQATIMATQAEILSLLKAMQPSI